MTANKLCIAGILIFYILGCRSSAPQILPMDTMENVYLELQLLENYIGFETAELEPNEKTRKRQEAKAMIKKEAN